MSRAILCRVGELPRVIFIVPDDAEGYLGAVEYALSGLVACPVACLSLDNGIQLWSSRDGFLLSLALARRVLARALAKLDRFDAPRIGDLDVKQWILRSDFLLARTAIDGGLADLTESDIRQSMCWLGLDYHPEPLNGRQPARRRPRRRRRWR